MRPGLEWIIYIAAIVCIGLAIAGGLSYPVVEQGVFGIVLFEAPVLLGIVAILFLIYKKGPSGS